MTFMTIWGIRLTFNFWRKGGYGKGGEDYRWVYIRNKYPRIVVELLNCFFTSYCQLFFLYFFSSPIKYSHKGDLNLIDYILVVIWLSLFIVEIIADQQQWNFQTTKYKYLASNTTLQSVPYPYSLGFIKYGLFSISRHPNFFCEISIWWVIFLFSLNSSGFNFTAIGPLLLNLLFLGSTALTEEISIAKYP